MLAPNRLPRAALSALSATAALILVTELLPVGVLPLMSRSLGVSEGQVGFLATAYAAAATLSAIPVSALTARLPRRPLLVAVLLGFATGNAVTAASSSYPVTIGARVLVGLLGGVAWSMLAGYAARIAPAELRGRAVAIALSGITLALVAGLPLAAAAATQFGWRATFLGLSGAALLLAAWSAMSLPSLSGEGAAGLPAMTRVVRLSGVSAVLIVTGTLLLGHQAAYTYLAAVAERVGGVRPSVGLLVFGLGAVAGIWVTGVLVDRHLRAVTIAALALVAGALLAVGVVLAAGWPSAAFLAAVAVWGLAFGGLPTALQTALIARAGTDNATAAGALQTTVYNVGVATGSLGGGVLLDHAGAAALPWAALPVVLLATAAVVRGRTTFTT
jgi:predicted MFS family arabinose efflux permease